MVYGSGTGSICYDQGLDEHSLLTQKSLKNQGKRPFRPKFSSPAARLKRKVGSLHSPMGDPQSNAKGGGGSAGPLDPFQMQMQISLVHLRCKCTENTDLWPAFEMQMQASGPGC